MSLPRGTRLGPYEILSPLGAGGMGEVYRATDTKLRREVAVKVLPEAFTQDAERLARFEREAQLLAQLHHPNISSIFGLEDAGGVRALVMELVEGPTLAERLAAGPLGIEECLTIAKQIAEALEEAHERGIVHRDLKPANVKLAPDGKVKVLDFGLAKALEPAGGPTSSVSDMSRSPTLIHGATQMGMILGTAAYMSPEQAVGGPVDRRSDIWAFGVVLFETLTGRRLFDGETVSHVLAAVLKDTPDFTRLPGTTPRRVVDLLRQCLRRKARERLQSIGDARVILEEVLADPDRDARESSASTSALTTPAPASKIPWLVAAGALAVAALFAVLWLGGRRGETPQRVLHLTVSPPSGMAFGDTFAVSPDGRQIVFEAYDQKTGARALWLRPLDQAEATKLVPTEGGEMPFWSPDGKHIGFFSETNLKRIDPQGGPAQVISDAPTPRGGAWGPDGRIVFADSFRTGLSIVPAAGGAAKPLTTLDASRNEKSHRWPVFLPGGKSILFLAQTAEGGARNDESAIEALEVETGKRTRLMTANASPLYAPGGQILFWRDGTLLSVGFDPATLRISGDPVPVASPVSFTQNEQALVSISTEGTMIYREGSRGTYSSLARFDRSGSGVVVIRDRALIGDDFVLSHDGKRLLYGMNSPGQGATDLWVQDLARGTTSRVTFEDGSESYPVWSPDDRFIYYASDRKNDGTIFRRPSDGSGTAEELGTTEQGIWPLAASADGRWLVAGAVGSGSGQDIFRFDLGTKAITPLVATPSFDQSAALSPDDRLLAYASEQSGRWEVYIQALGGHGKWQISVDGGLRPRWRADGREIYFLSLPDKVMSVEVEPGDVPRFSTPRELFRAALDDFDAAPDGKSFVGLRPADSDITKPLTVIFNWPQLIRK